MKNRSFSIKRCWSLCSDLKTWVAALAVVSLGLLPACQTGKSAKVTSERELAPVPAEKPPVVYVADFELGAQEIKHEDGMLSGRQGPIGRVGDRLSGASKNPAERARQVVDLMANSLVKDLAKAGFNAQRLPAGAPLPTQGWILQGVFIEVQEGNRLRRAMVGFGQGQTDLQVVTKVQDLASGPLKPLYEIATDANSGAKPGAAPTLAMSPYGAAARFVMAGHDLEKNVKQTASEIVAQLAKRYQEKTGKTTNP